MSKEKRKSKEFPCIETTIDLQILDIFVVRIWVNKDKLPTDYKYELKLIEKIKEKMKGDDFDINDADNDLIRFIAKQPNVNAVQILDKDFEDDYKIGTVAYIVDFVDDVHG